MDKIPCQVIKDLLPLYCDEVCSEESRKIIAEHLDGCDNCKCELENIQTDITIPREAIENNYRDSKALEAISDFWNRSKTKAFVKGVSITALIFAIGVLGYIVLFHWNTFTVPTKVIKITDVCKLKDGRIAYHVKLTDGYNLDEVKFHMDEEGDYYLTPYRPIIKTKAEVDGGLGNMYYLFDPAGHALYETIYGKGSEIKVLYFGSREDHILVWENGMKLPAASKEIEAMLSREEDRPPDWKKD